MQSPYVIELDSQTELLERIALLSHFRSNLIAVCGEVGSGKTWLAQRYLEQKAQSQNQSLLLCRAEHTEAYWRSQILEQLVSSPLYNPNDPLADSFTGLFEQQRCDAIIVIDNAHLLTAALLNELWDLVCVANDSTRWRVNVVLFSLPNHLESTLNLLTDNDALKPIELDIEPLSESEAMLLFEKQVARYLDDAREKHVRHAFRLVRPLPGDILALGEMKVEKRIIIRSIVASPLNMTLLLLILILMLAGGYWWLFNQPKPEPVLDAVLEQTVIPTLSRHDRSEIGFQDSTGRTELPLASSENLADSTLTDDSMALPPPVISDMVSVGIADDEHQRVVIDSDVVDAIMEGEPEQDGEALASDVLPLETLHQTEGGKETIEADITSQSRETEKSEPSSPFAASESELAALSPRSYTLQLAALTSVAEVEAFIRDHQLQNTARVYTTRRQDKAWFIIIYRDYATIQQARDAIATLPASLQKLGPWAKSMGQVQRELRNTK